MIRRALIVLAPLAAGAVAAAILTGTAPSVQLYAEGSPGALALVTGGAGTVIAALIVWVASRTEVHRELVTAESADEEARSDRRRFLMRLDHELKNPLTAIRAGIANVSALADPTDQGIAEALASVDAQAVRLSRLTSDLRKIAEIETQNMTVSPVEIADLLEDVKSAVEQSTGRSITLIIHQAPVPLGAVTGDEDLLFLAVHNLLANAAKFCGPAGAVEVRAFRDPPWVVIEVADAGPGIPMDELTLIWEELGRGRAARGLTGSGLGLAMVRTIVGRHGGNVEVWSEEGRGTMFTLRLHPAASIRTQQLGVTGHL